MKVWKGECMSEMGKEARTNLFRAECDGEIVRFTGAANLSSTLKGGFGFSLNDLDEFKEFVRKVRRMLSEVRDDALEKKITALYGRGGLDLIKEFFEGLFNGTFLRDDGDATIAAIHLATLLKIKGREVPTDYRGILLAIKKVLKEQLGLDEDGWDRLYIKYGVKWKY